MILAQGQRALRFEGVVVAAAAAASGGEFVGCLQRAVRGSFVGDDFIVAGGIRHDEDCTLGMLVLCVTEGWGDDTDRERDHPEDVTYLAHFSTPGFLSRAEWDKRTDSVLVQLRAGHRSREMDGSFRLLQMCYSKRKSHGAFCQCCNFPVASTSHRRVRIVTTQLQTRKT
jgi:hypothetical protein